MPQTGKCLWFLPTSFEVPDLHLDPERSLLRPTPLEGPDSFLTQRGLWFQSIPSTVVPLQLWSLLSQACSGLGHWPSLVSVNIPGLDPLLQRSLAWSWSHKGHWLRFTPLEILNSSVPELAEVLTLTPKPLVCTGVPVFHFCNSFYSNILEHMRYI